MILNELNNNQYSKAAKKYVKNLYPNLTGSECHEKFNMITRSALRRVSDLDECTNGVAPAFFTKGVVRLYCESELNGTPYDKHAMSDVIEFMIQHPNPQLDNDFNYTTPKGKIKQIKSVEELYQKTFGKLPKNNDIRDINLAGINMSEDGKYLEVGRYTIYNTFSYDTMKKYVKLPSENSICYVGNLKNFHSDESNHGMRAKYACVRDDYRTVKKIVGENYPEDDYGLSLIIISISPNGAAEVCSRWNNGAKGMQHRLKPGRTTASTYLTKEEVEQIVLNGQYKFEDVFKPFDEETYEFRRSNGSNFRHLSKTLNSFGTPSSKDGRRKQAEEEMEPKVTAWLRANGSEEYPFKEMGEIPSQYKMAESIKLNINDLSFILKEAIKRLK